MRLLDVGLYRRPVPAVAISVRERLVGVHVVDGREDRRRTDARSPSTSTSAIASLSS
jgi:hypothetical protein